MPKEIIGLIQFAVLVLGFTYYLTASVIFAPIRMWVHSKNLTLGYLMYCPTCASTWIGAVLGACGAYPFKGLIHPIFDAAVMSMIVVMHFLPAEIPFDHPSNK